MTGSLLPTVGTPVTGAAVPGGHSFCAHGGGAPGGEAEGGDPLSEGADPGRAVSEGEPGGHTAAGD